MTTITKKEKELILHSISNRDFTKKLDKALLTWCQSGSSSIEDLTPDQRYFISQALNGESDIEKLINELKENGETESIKQLIQLTFHKDNWSRLLAFEAINQQPINDDIIERNRQGTQDEYDLVRIESVSMLGESGDTQSFHTLYELMTTDKSALVRASSISSIAQIVYKIIEELINGYDRLSLFEKVTASIFLYSIGFEKFLDEIKKMLVSNDYEIRSRVVNDIKNFYFFFTENQLNDFIIVFESRLTDDNLSAGDRAVIENALDKLTGIIDQ